MLRSQDPGHYFQTTSALEETARKATKSKNTKGSPIKLPSKILATVADPQDENQIYVAEAAGAVKRVNLETSGITAIYSGPTSPLTSLAISTRSNLIFAGCWDKSIWSWSITTRKPAKRFQGHNDFVKAVLVVSVCGQELLISASQDASIIVWNVATGEKIHTLKGHTRGVLSLAVDPAECEPTKLAVIIFSAGSDREIRRWCIGLSSASEVQPTPILVHETSIDNMHFDSDGDIWTASADKTTKCLSRDRKWEEDSKFEHPDFVRDVVVDEDGGWVCTACRDEEVRIWGKGSGKLHHVFAGHFEEVTGLVLLSGQRLVSVSIDGTVRQWSLSPRELAKAVEEAKDEGLVKTKGKEPEQRTGLMTAEEEAELAELMEDSD